MDEKRQGEIAFSVLRQILNHYLCIAPRRLRSQIARIAKKVGFCDAEAEEFAETVMR